MNKALPITKYVKLINKKEFAKAALDQNFEIFVIHIVFLDLGIHPDREV